MLYHVISHALGSLITRDVQILVKQKSTPINVAKPWENKAFPACQKKTHRIPARIMEIHATPWCNQAFRVSGHKSRGGVPPKSEGTIR